MNFQGKKIGKISGNFPKNFLLKIWIKFLMENFHWKTDLWWKNFPFNLFSLFNFFSHIKFNFLFKEIIFQLIFTNVLILQSLKPLQKKSPFELTENFPFSTFWWKLFFLSFYFDFEWLKRFLYVSFSRCVSCHPLKMHKANEKFKWRKIKNVFMVVYYWLWGKFKTEKF